jgi:hypothetical protein
MTRQFWTVQEVETLKRLYPECRTETLALLLKRNTSSIHHKANVLSIKKSQGFMKSPLSGRMFKIKMI